MTIARPTVATVSMTDADTEYSYLFPDGTKKFTIRLRALNAILKIYGFSAGGSAFIGIPYGDFMDVDAKVGGGTIYFQSAKAAQTAEIITWK